MASPDHLHQCCEIDVQVAQFKLLIMALLEVDARRREVAATTDPGDLVTGVIRSRPIMEEYESLIEQMGRVIDGQA